MGVLERYLQLTQNPYAGAPAGETAGTLAVPQVDSSNAIGSLAAMMGPTPAEREATERRMQKNQAQMAMWTGVMDGLRQLGNLYYAYKGAIPQKFDNPYQQVSQQYQQQRGLYNDMANYRRQYATSLYNLQRQMDADKRAKETHQAQMDYTKAREEALRADSKRKDEYNEARTKYYDAIVNKNDEQAEYWRLRAQGVPKESAAKIAKDYALAAKANRTGGGSGGRGANNGTYGYRTTTYIDDQGRKITERVPTTGGKPETTVHEPKSPQQPKKPAKKAASKGKGSSKSSGKGGTNNSGFFNK